MITRNDIERLATLHSENGILSAHILIDPRLAYDRHQPEAKFKGALASVRRTADEHTIAILDRERDKVLEYLSARDQRGKGIAVFSCTPDGIWEVVELDVAVPTRLTVANNPDVDLLARAIDENPRLAVLLLDGGDARFYLSEQGESAEAGGVSEDIPNRHDQGGWSQARYQRHVEVHRKAHLSEVAEVVKDSFYEQGFARLVLVGVDAAANEFEALLPDPVRQRVIGQLNADFKQESDAEILQRAGQLAEDDERSTEVALVEQVIGYTDMGGKGALGLDDTVLALIEGRVDIIVLVEGLSAAGSRCQNCDYFSAHKFVSCPICSSSEVDELSDVVEHAVEHAVLNGSQVNFVYSGAEEMLQSRGGIGALLRYVVAEAEPEEARTTG